MKAAVLHTTGRVEDGLLSIEDAPVPEPGPGQVRLRARVCGVCRTDLHVLEAELDQTRQRMPLIPGHSPRAGDFTAG